MAIIDTDQESVMHSKSDNIEVIKWFMIKQRKSSDNILSRFLKRYQIGLGTSTKGSDFIFDPVHSLYDKCHRINLNCSRSYRVYPDWIKDEKSTINPFNDDDKCFQHAAAVSLNHGKNWKISAKNIKN